MVKTTKLAGALLLAWAVVGSGAIYARGAAKPLSADDVTLLLIGGASPQKMIALIQARGVDFKLDPDLVKQFYQDGATDDVIDALQKAGHNIKAPPAATPPERPAPPAPPRSGPGEAPLPLQKPAVRSVVPGPAPSAGSASSSSSSAPTLGRAGAAASTEAPAPPRSASAASAKPAPPAPANTTGPLPDPSPAAIQHIIQTFAAREALFKAARDNYTYHQLNRVETLDADGQVTGAWQQDWDILFDNNGQRIEHVTYAPESTLKSIMVTEQDLDSLRSIQPFVLTTEELPEYSIRYLGHVHIDYITAYVFAVRPKVIKKGRQYFDGVVWVDDHDLQIVKAEGRTVPELRSKNGQNLFPRFSTWRQQIDGKYWFPTFTMADDTLYFDSGPVRIREIIKYTDYKQFKSKVRILSATPIDRPNSSQTPRP
ncbi:MAG: hypothetical protein ACRD10_00240 [Terriglobia bacterium]